MKLADFKAKHVPGLYIFHHFEHESGAFIQAHAAGGHWIYQEASGKRQEFWDLDELRKAVEG